MHRMRLTHPALDCWIDVRLREFDGRWLAVADLMGTPELGTGETSTEALRAALAPFARELRDQLIVTAEHTQGCG